MTNPDQAPWQGCHVYKIFRERRNGRRYAMISGWPTPVPETARTLFPPTTRRPSYCIEARRWAKSVLHKNKHKKTGPWIGAYSLRWLRAVADGKRPLQFSDFHGLKMYQAPKPPPQIRIPVRLNIAGWGRP